MQKRKQRGKKIKTTTNKGENKLASPVQQVTCNQLPGLYGQKPQPREGLL